MSAPNWKDAPEWANYVAKDADGDWYWYASKPHRGHRAWSPNSRCEQAYADEEMWQDTLSERPE